VLVSAFYSLVTLCPSKFSYADEWYIAQLVQANGAFVTLPFSLDFGLPVSCVVVIPDYGCFLVIYDRFYLRKVIYFTVWQKPTSSN
jgi:hypothetical protein